MAKPKKVAKKVAKKRSKKEEQFDALQEDNVRLAASNTKLRRSVDDLRTQIADLVRAATPPIDSQNWTRGKLPGGELLKIDRQTGKHYKIDKTEWDSLR